MFACRRCGNRISEKSLYDACLRCGLPFRGPGVAACPTCGRADEPAAQNAPDDLGARVTEWRAAGLIDEATERRLHDHIAAHVPASAPAPTSAPTARPVPASAPAAGPDLTGLRTADLLLYLGAFLLAVAAVLLTSLSSGQIADRMRFAMLVVGTGAFLGLGAVLQRTERVREAGRTFLFIGALGVPLTVAAYGMLALGLPRPSPEQLTLVGGVLTAGLYALLAESGAGRAYAWLHLLAAGTAALALPVALGLPLSFRLVSLAAVLALHGLTPVVHRAVWQPVQEALRVGASLLVPIAAVIAFGAAADSDRVAPVVAALATLLLGAVLIAHALRRPGDRWLPFIASVSLGLVPVNVLMGAALSELAWGWSLFGVGMSIWVTSQGRGMPLLGAVPPVWHRSLRYASYVFGAAALLPVAAYERAPLHGALLYASMAGVLAFGAWRANSRHLTLALAVTGALLLVAWRWGIRALLPELPLGAPEWARAYLPLVLLVWALVPLTVRLRPQVLPHVLVGALAAAQCIAAAMYADPGWFIATALGAAALSAAAWWMLHRPAERDLRAVLWVSAFFVFQAAFSLERVLDAPSIVLRMTMLAPAVIAFTAGALMRPLAPLRLPALVYATALALLGLIEARPGVPEWHQSVGVLALVTASLTLHGRLERSADALRAAGVLGFMTLLAALAGVPGIGFTAQCWAVAVYLFTFVAVVRRTRLLGETALIEAAASVAVILPFYRDGLPDHLAGVLLCALALAVAGTLLRRSAVLLVGAAALGLLSFQVLGDVAARLPGWALFSIAGIALLTGGSLMLFWRDRIEMLRVRIKALWRSRS